MEYNIKVHKKPYGDETIFKKTTLTLTPGVYILCGCNGAGKSTLLMEIVEFLRKEKTDFVEFNGKRDAGSNLTSRALFEDNLALTATSICSSEGENLHIAIGEFAKKIGHELKRENKKEFWVLCDAIDSGMSIDQVLDIQDFFVDFLPSEVKDTDLFVIMASNQFEMTRKGKCIDVINLEEIEFNGYEDYKKFILKTQKLKEKRAK